MEKKILDEIGRRSSIDIINNYAYTISEHNLEEWYHDFVYNYPTGYRSGLWFVYDLAINNQLCYQKAIDTEFCYVSEEETKDIVDTMIFDGEEVGYRFFRTGQVESSKHGITTYGSAESALLEKTIDYAYIISKGPDTSGYEEAMLWTYELSQYNRNTLSYEDFEEEYYDQIKDYDEVLGLVKNMSLTELVENYDIYYSEIREVSTHVNKYMIQKSIEQSEERTLTAIKELSELKPRG